MSLQNCLRGMRLYPLAFELWNTVFPKLNYRIEDVSSLEVVSPLKLNKSKLCFVFSYRFYGVFLWKLLGVLLEFSVEFF